MRSTIAEARRQFEEEIVPRVNDHMTKRGRDILAAAEQKAKDFASGYADRRASEAMSLRDAALRELTEVRDSLDQLTSSGSEGRLEATGYADQLAKLRARQKQAEEQLDRAESIAEDISGVEADPVAWYDQLSRRIKSMRMDFPW